MEDSTMPDPTPGEWAAAEQLTMHFRELTKKLTDLMVQTVETEGTSEAIRLRKLTAQTLLDAMEQTNDPDAILNYVMFLIGTVSYHRRQALAIGDLVNKMARNLDAMGKVVGMVPVVTR